ncbi:Engulfment and cell motility protein 2 [Erysiphe neolycopersici]|uniref:Engulfment and cell motility protein 2 n=1 Tax=Erysiphe neolycopersici TaxID=212602 RepID=A0A420HDH0_9PEZI|nr:Engulfment and cell motility protein 2 [Erysiphe neolycopersici]
MNQADIPELLTRLQSDEDATRKLAVFKLQASINDPSIADVFISTGGLKVLQQLIMTSSGNTLAYALAALSRLLEVEMGWEIFESNGAEALVERLVGLIVTQPLVNILRGAMSILVAVVGHSQNSRKSSKVPEVFGFRALKPAVAVYPQFFEMVVLQLKSADHLLCSNALMLLNALLRDGLSKVESKEEKSVELSRAGEKWPQLINKLQDLGIVQAAYDIMQSSSLQDMAHSLLEFQTVSKLILKKRRDTEVQLENLEHQDILENIYLSSQKKNKKEAQSKIKQTEHSSKDGKRNGSEENSYKWRNLGFQTENLSWDFEQTGFLGLMDLACFVSKDEDGFQKLLQEQDTRPSNERCPIARASLSVTRILYDHFEIDRSDPEDIKNYRALDGMKNYADFFRPFILQWSRIHKKALSSFIILWKQVGADQEEFVKVVELLRILIDKVLSGVARTKDIKEIEEEIGRIDHRQLRKIQMEVLNNTFEDEWELHLTQIREELRGEALQFMKEQRIRSLLNGSWFHRTEINNSITESQNETIYSPAWQYVKLSYDRRYLHYGNFDSQAIKNPSMDVLSQKIDLENISSVDSNTSSCGNEYSGACTPTTVVTARPSEAQTTITGITIRCFASTQKSDQCNSNTSNGSIPEKTVLVLIPTNKNLASSWLDGLLMLLNQAPITPETNKLINFICDYGLKIRLLNVRMDDFLDSLDGAGTVPSREGLDEDYFYEM